MLSRSSSRLRFAGSARVLALLATLFVLATLSACGAKQSPSLLTYDAPALEADGFDYPHLRYTDDGRLVVDGADSALRSATHYTLHPPFWDEETLGEEPVIGAGMLVHGRDMSFAVAFAGITLESAAPPRVRAASDLVPLTNHKGIVHIERTMPDGDGNIEQVQLSRGSAHGVARGDWFFVLTRDAVDARQPRLGDRIGALLRVEHVTRDGATAEVIHAHDGLLAGQEAVFAHRTALMPPFPIGIHVAPLSDEAEHADELPAMMRAVPELSAEYRISNTAIHRLADYIDPRTWDASYNAEDAAPDEGWGIVVFGDTEGQTLIYNATGFGSVPAPSGWVGILPGGLPIPFEDSVEELSPALAISYLSNGLGMRGDHAHAIYLVESELRRAELHPQLRYHLREHLALRYEALGRGDESMRLMHYDLHTAADEDDVLSQLNALSIRGYLARQVRLSELAVADSRRFIELAEGVLPAYGVDSERVVLARGLIDIGELDEAERIASRAASEAAARGDHRQHFVAIIELTSVQLLRDQHAAALLVLDDLRQNSEHMRLDTQVAIRVLAAEIYAQMEDYRNAVETLFENFDHFDALPASGRASLLTRAAGIMMQVNEPIQATRAVLDAAEIYEALGVQEQAAMMRLYSAQFQMNLASSFDGQQALSLLIDARADFRRAEELFLGMGELAHAAEALTYNAILSARFEQTGAEEPLFDRAGALYLGMGDFAAMHTLAAMRAQIAESIGDAAGARHYAAEAERWGALVERAQEALGPMPDESSPLTSEEEH